MMDMLYFYICAGFIAPIFFIANIASLHKDFYSTVVELTNSAFFDLLCVNAFIAFVFLSWRVSRWLFFGKLNKDETDAVQRALPVYFSECIVGPFYFDVSIISVVGAASLMTVVIRLLHKLAEERVTTLPIIGNRTERLRMLRGLFLFFMLLMPLDLYVIFDVWAFASLNPENVSGLRYIAALLYIQLVVANVQCLVRIGFSKGGRDSVKTSRSFYTETFIDLLRCIVFFASFSYVSFISHMPLPLMRLLFHHVTLFFQKTHRLLCYWQLTQFVRRIPNASDEDLSRDPRCPICCDDMSARDGCKRLPCGHCYHEPCLQRCFETKSSCPYCGADLIALVRRAEAKKAAPPAAAAAAAEKQRENREEVAVNEADVARAYALYRLRWQAAQRRPAPVDVRPLQTFRADEGAKAQAEEQSKEQQRLAAYKMYEETIRAASVALETQLRAIESRE